MIKNILKAFAAIVFIIVFSPTIEASHFSSGEIYYEYVGPGPNGCHQYKVYVNWYRNMSGIGITQGTQTVCVSSSCGPDITFNANRVLPPAGQAKPGDPQAWQVTGLDECAVAGDPNFKDLSVHKFEGTVCLPSNCADYVFSANAVCCRDQSTNLATSPNMYLEARLNNTFGQNSSAQILAPAGKAFCLVQPGQRPFQFVQTAFDPDNDSIEYGFAHPQSGVQCGPGTNIPLAAGFSVNAPIPSSTPFTIDQQRGVFSFSPSQAGGYVVKIEIEDFRFDTTNLAWLAVGSMVREIQVPVTANCNPQAQNGPQLDLNSSTTNTSISNFSNTQIDSILNAYNIRQLLGADSIGNGVAQITQVATYNSYQCFDSIIRLEFDNNVRCESAVPTDFRLIGPDGVARPIVGIDDNCQFNNTRTIDLQLFRPLDLDGNYLLQLRRGNDGNTLTNECGYELTEGYTAIIPVNNCPKPEVRLERVTVDRDLDIRLDWSGNADLLDPSVVSLFNNWTILRADAGQPLQVRAQYDSATARFFVDSFGGNGYFVDHFMYDYAMFLVYNGKGREFTRTCTNMVLRVDSANTNDDNYSVYWNDYYCIDEVNRQYFVQRGQMDTVDFSIDWAQEGSTTDTSFVLAKPDADSLTQGTYAVRVIARDINGASFTDSSESNWQYYSIVYFPPVIEPEPEVPGQVIIPNIITPNGDMLNDRFYIQPPLEGVQFAEISLTIYNRWGELVFEDPNFQDNNDETNGWAGVGNNGQQLANGVYYYIIELRDPASNTNQTMQGNVTINGAL